MKTRKRSMLFVIATVSAVMLGLSPAQADASNYWSDTWHQVKFQVKSVCEKPGSAVLSKDAGSTPGYIYIINAENPAEVSAVVAIYFDDAWYAAETTFEMTLGGLADAVLKTTAPVDIAEGSVTLFFYFRLTGKEKSGLLASGKVASVAGFAEYPLFDDDGECNAALTFKGKLVDAGRVPLEVHTAVGDEL